MAVLYDGRFYEEQQADSLSSARATVPLVLSFVNARSVVDLGCGIGTWLNAFRETGIEDVVGYDGDWVRADQLLIPSERFVARDLTKPLKADRKYDLAISLEVAEHLPKSAADEFVRSLCSLAPVVLFSAATPGQFGVSHVNPQWPWYWHDKFESNGFVTLDALRPKLLLDRRVAPWYRQNMYLMVRRDVWETTTQFKDAPQVDRDDPVMLITGPVLVSNLRMRASLQRMPGLVLELLADRLVGRKRRWPWDRSPRP